MFNEVKVNNFGRGIGRIGRVGHVGQDRNSMKL